MEVRISKGDLWKPLENVMFSNGAPAATVGDRHSPKSRIGKGQRRVQNVQNPGGNQRFLLSSKRSDGLPKNIEKEKLNALCKAERAAADRRIVRNAIFRSYQLWLDYFASSLVCRQQTPGIQRTLGDLQAIGWESLQHTWNLVENDPAR